MNRAVFNASTNVVYLERPPRLLGYVIKDSRLHEKRAALKARAGELKTRLHRVIIDRGATSLLDRSRPWWQISRIMHNFDQYDMMLAWLSDLGGKRKELLHALDFLIKTPLTLYLILDSQECLTILPTARSYLGLRGLHPEALRALDAIIDKVNHQYQVDQFRRSVKQRRKEHLRVSRRPPLGMKFLRRGGKTFVVKDRAFRTWLNRLLAWRQEGATIDECQRRLSRAGARNPATGTVWSRWRVMRALKFAGNHKSEVQAA